MALNSIKSKCLDDFDFKNGGLEEAQEIVIE